MQTFVALSLRTPDFRDRIISQVTALCSAYVPQGYKPTPQVWMGRQTAVIVWQKLGFEGPAFIQHAGSLIAISGYLTDPAGPQAILQEAHIGSGSIRLPKSYGGVAAFCFVDQTEQVFSWTTHPPVYGVYQSNNHPHYSVLSPRPLLAYLAASRRDSLTLRSNYALEVLASGYSAIGTTPYENTNRIPVTHAAWMKDKQVRIIPYPRSSEEHAANTEGEAAEAYSEHLRRAMSPLKGTPARLRLSGGKDSRTIAAVVFEQELQVQALTMGSPQSGETKVAAKVADAVGLIHEVRPQGVIADPIRAAAKSHMSTEGLITGVPHQFSNSMNGLEGNTVLMTGQGHLQRGGYADIAALSWNSKQAERILKGKVTSDLVGREVNDINRQVIDQWLDVRSKQINGSPVNLLHWGNADFRLGYWYASTFMAMDGVTPLLMPLLDDRVCSFLTATAPEWRVYETMNFRSIRTMAPQLAQLPLYNDRWRFEQGGPIEGFPGYDLRAPLPKVTDAKTKDGITYDESPRRFDPLQQYICQAVLDSMIWKEIRRNLGHELILQIESQAAGRGNTQYWSCLGNRRGPYQQVLLRVFLVAMLYSCQWLKPSRILDPGLRT